MTAGGILDIVGWALTVGAMAGLSWWDDTRPLQES